MRESHNFQTHVDENCACYNFDEPANMGSKGASVEYLSAGANRQTAVADWGSKGLLAFGADTNVALWEPAVSFP